MFCPVLSTQYSVLNTQYSILNTQYSILGTGYWVLGTGYWVLGTGYWVLGTGYWVLGTDSHTPSHFTKPLQVFASIASLLPETPGLAIIRRFPEFLKPLYLIPKATFRNF